MFMSGHFSDLIDFINFCQKHHHVRGYIVQNSENSYLKIYNYVKVQYNKHKTKKKTGNTCNDI